MDLDFLPAEDADGFEIFRSPNRAGAAAAVDAVTIVAHRGVPDEVFPRRPDAENARPDGRLEAGGEGVGHGVNVLSPKGVSGKDFHFIRGDIDPNGRRGLALDDEGVVTRGLERPTPAAARVGRADDAGEGRLEDHMAAGRGRSVRSDERRGGQGEDIFGTEGIASRVDGVVKQARRQAAPAEIVGPKSRVQGKNPGVARGKVDLENFSVEAERRGAHPNSLALINFVVRSDINEDAFSFRLEIENDSKIEFNRKTPEIFKFSG